MDQLATAQHPAYTRIAPAPQPATQFEELNTRSQVHRALGGLSLGHGSMVRDCGTLTHRFMGRPYAINISPVEPSHENVLRWVIKSQRLNAPSSQQRKSRPYILLLLLTTNTRSRSALGSRLFKAELCTRRQHLLDCSKPAPAKKFAGCSRRKKVSSPAYTATDFAHSTPGI